MVDERDPYLRAWKRLRLYGALVLLSWIAFILIIVLGDRLFPVPRSGVATWIMLGTAFGALVGPLVPGLLFRCPRCEGFFWWGKNGRLSYPYRCGKCGIEIGQSEG